MEWQAAPVGYHLLRPGSRWPQVEPVIAWARVPVDPSGAKHAFVPVGLTSGVVTGSAVISTPDGTVHQGNRAWKSVQTWHEDLQKHGNELI